MLRSMDKELPDSEKEIWLQRTPRTMISYSVLICIESFTLLLLILRAYVFSNITMAWALIISITSTFVTTSENEVKATIKEAGSILAISMSFKILKAFLVIMVFTYNGTTNDFFVGAFFFWTCKLGKNYLGKSGYKLPNKPFLKEKDKTKIIDCDKLDNTELEAYFSRITILADEDILKQIKNENLYELQFSAILQFMLMMFLTAFLEPICRALGMNHGIDDYSVSTLGISASIMILYSMIAWP